MPRYYHDPRSSAVAAINLLEEAYEKNLDTYTGSLILKAIAALTNLQEDLQIGGSYGRPEYDPHEINESNSAL